MSQRTQHRTGITKFPGYIMDEAKNLADDVLDRTANFEQDIRNALSKGLAVKEPTGPDRKTTSPDSEELARLKGEMAALQEKFNRLTGTPEHGEAAETSAAKPASH